jgi:hypothetical protein
MFATSETLSDFSHANSLRQLHLDILLLKTGFGITGLSEDKEP